MCQAGQPPAAPATAAQAMAMAQAGLGWLAEAHTAALTTAEQADCLRSLEQARSAHTAARSRVLAAPPAITSPSPDAGFRISGNFRF
jgi:hypothetical protein